MAVPVALAIAVGVIVACAGVAVLVTVGTAGDVAEVSVGSAVVGTTVGDGAGVAGSGDGATVGATAVPVAMAGCVTTAAGVTVDVAVAANSVAVGVADGAGVAVGSGVASAIVAAGVSVGIGVRVADGGADNEVSVARPTVAGGVEGLLPKRATRMITPVRNANAARINWMLGRCDGSGFMRLFSANSIGQRLYRASCPVVNASGLAALHRPASQGLSRLQQGIMKINLGAAS